MFVLFWFVVFVFFNQTMGSLKQSWSRNWLAEVWTLNPLVTTNVPRGGVGEGRRKGGVGSVGVIPPQFLQKTTWSPGDKWYSFNVTNSMSLTCRTLCMGHLTSTWSNHSSLLSVSRNHSQTSEDCSYWDSNRSAQFLINSFSLAWTSVSSKNDVPG